MSTLGSVLKTNSLISLCLSVWMCLFFIPLSPHSLQNPVIFGGFFHHSSCCFSPSCFIFPLLSSFFFLQLFPPSTVSFSLFIIPSRFSPLCHFHLLPPPSLALLQQNEADIVLRDETCSKVKYHYTIWLSFGCFRNFARCFFFWGGGRGGGLEWKKLLVANVSTNTQWIVLILHKFRFIHLRQAW